MKKLLALTLALSMSLSLAACGGSAPSAASSAPAADSTPADSQPAAESEAPAADVVWPDGKDVYVDVAARAGGGTDLMVRYLTTPWAAMIDGNIVVNNYDTTEVGIQHAANAAPDGLTLTIGSTVNMDNYLTGASEGHPVDDFTVIAKFTAGGPQALVAKPDAPFNNLTEMAEYAKEHPGELITGVSLGATSHLVWINLTKAMGGVELNYVQAGGEADKLTNLASGSLDLANCSLNNARAYEEDGKIKVIGIVGPNETLGKDDIDSTLPDNYKTTWEQGFKNASWQAGGYLCGPADMDPALVNAIYESMKQVENDASFQEGMASMSQIVEFKGPEEATADYMAEWDTQVALTTDLGINVRN